MKIFTNNIPFEIIPSDQQPPERENQYVLGNAAIMQIMKHYELISSSKVKGTSANFLFKVKDYPTVTQQFKHFFHELEAAGGIVEKDGQVLFIKRLGKWDLPKGKVEKGESIEETAIREVEEECKIEVDILEKVGITWHTYIQKGMHMLKCTHWYRMKCLNDQHMAPQKEEDIEELRWIHKKQVEDIALSDTYQSICEIYQKYEASTKIA